MNSKLIPHVVQDSQGAYAKIFKAKRGSTPREFRAMFKKNRVIV